MAGDVSSRNALVEHNIRLAVKMANEWRGNAAGVELDDLVQEAMLGLQFAAAKFDPHKGFRFTTYATRWIGRQLWNAVHQGGPVKYNDETTLRIVKVRRIIRGRPDATVAEVATAAKCSVAQAADALVYAQSFVSLDDEYASAGRSATAAEHVTEVAIDDVVEFDEPSDGLARVLDQFRDDPIAMRAISMKYGLDGGPWTVDDIAAHLSAKYELDIAEARTATNDATKQFRRALRRERQSGALPIAPAAVECVRRPPAIVGT